MSDKHCQTLKEDYPWASSPLVSSAPMRLISTSPLAVAVSRAGGLGFLGAGTDVSNLSTLLNQCQASLQNHPMAKIPENILPIGVGFICWGADLVSTLQVMSNAPFKPAAAWLFAPKVPSDLFEWSEGIRMASNGHTKIWIQVGTVAMALEVAKTCKPDVLVIQGSDAGGHGLAQSSSVIALLPECADALAKEGFGNIPLIAAGGIVDGRGVAAALTLGASGVSMGTRFLCTPESITSAGYRDAIIKSRDGGVATARTTVYDQLRGTQGWPESYNGRGILNQSFFDHQDGMTFEENKQLYEKSTELGDEGWGSAGRMTTYAGTGVGLVHKVMPAEEIVAEVLSEYRLHLMKVVTRFQI